MKSCHSNPVRNYWVVFVLLATFLAIGLTSSMPAIAQRKANVVTEKKNSKSKTQQKKKQKIDYSNRFIRIRRDAKGKPLAMETSIVRYFGKNKKGQRVIVDLIGVVHIGEKAYYEKLNKRFTQYDALLYELVAPEGTKIPKGGARGGSGVNPIAALQKTMQASLGLEFQLDHIDYTKDNFVHADMSPTEFMESMKNNNESFVKSFFRAMGQSMAMQNSAKSGSTDAEMLMALFSGDRETQLRKVMAEQMQNIESGMLIFEGDDGSTIINHRNRKALSVMEREIDKGNVRLGVFYGAGHLPDMEERLYKDFGMKRAGTSWLSAWSLQSKPAKKRNRK